FLTLVQQQVCLTAMSMMCFDASVSAGQIMRLTIPRSQGKQEYYDARKTSWGDIFPHEPKNAPQVRCQPSNVSQRGTPTEGSDIGKRKSSRRPKDKQMTSYSQLATEITANKKQKKWERTRSKSV